ncbi:hypothetical protein [Novosphingobium aquimarinum]|uniref:hypothetical protein n=1 Tax=Novosphingobium aquimarinum TaxID=2682494 RepID=UPI0012EB7172|nr:hypothetical protein [Novosphingobium aquimarinum]
MRIIRLVLLVIGVLAIAMGLLWTGQGTGLVMWPASSFMLADRSWAINGAILAVVGGIIVWLARPRAGR